MNTIYWIIEYGATLTEMLMYMLFSGTFIENTDFKQSFLKKFIASNSAAILIILINHIKLYSLITAICNLLIILLMLLITYKKTPVKAVVFGISFTPILSVFDNIVVSVISYTFEIPVSEIYQKMSFYRILAIIMSKTALLLFVMMINKFFSKNKIVPRKYLLTLFAVTIIMFVIISSVAFIDIKNKSVNSYISVLFFVMMLILLMTFFFGTFKLAEYYENQQQLKLITLKNQMLEQSMNETEQTFMLWKTSIHDFKHKIMNLMMLADNNDIAGIKQYLEAENELLGKKLFYYKTGSDTVDTILNIKQKIAEKNGITFIINAEIPENCNISSADFASILGNLLDNAIEASEKEKEPFIEVNIKPVKSYLIINVLNKYTGSEDCSESTKNEKHLHGIGIHSVKQTVKKYGGEFNTGISDNIFNVKIMIQM